MSRKNREKRTHKKLAITPEVRKIIENQLEAFRKKFNREPSADDPLFFDPDGDTPQIISEANMAAMPQEMLDIAHEAGLPPDKIYAIRKTGRIVMEQNQHNLALEEMQE